VQEQPDDLVLCPHATFGLDLEIRGEQPVAPLSRPTPSTCQMTEPRNVPSSPEGSSTPAPTVCTRSPPPLNATSPSSSKLVAPVIVTRVV